MCFMLLSTGAFASDEETYEYCVHKYEQITEDIAFEQNGCQFSAATKAQITRNRNNTFQNCKAVLDDETRLEIGKMSKMTVDMLFKKIGKKDACEYLKSSYPKRIYE